MDNAKAIHSEKPMLTNSYSPKWKYFENCCILTLTVLEE
jgi:hypothetical protein